MATKTKEVTPMQKKVVALSKRAVATVLACSLMIAAAPVSISKGAAKEPKLNQKKIIVMEGLSETLTVKKNGFTIKSTKWSSADKKIATVKKGEVTGVSEGKTTVTAKVKAVAKGQKKAKTYTLKCKVTVTPEEIVGGWEFADDPTITEEVKNYVAEMKGPNHSFEAVALLATQVVAGMNYCVLAKKKTADKSTFTVIEFYVNTEQVVELIADWATTVETDKEGFTAPPSPKIPEEYYAKLSEIVSKYDKAALTPVAMVELNTTTGQGLLICHTVPNASDFGDCPPYSFVCVSVDQTAGTGKLEKVDYLTEILAGE